MLLEESITYVGMVLALHQMLYIWYIAKNVKSKALGPQFHGNQSHMIKNVCSCRITTHFIDECCDEEIHFKYLAFVIIEKVNNTSVLTHNRIEDLILEKGKCLIGILVTQHQELNSTHDWNHTMQAEREKKTIIHTYNKYMFKVSKISVYPFLLTLKISITCRN